MYESFGKLIANGTKLFQRNSPEIFSALGVVGIGATAYLAAKASFTAVRVIDASEETGSTAENSTERLKENTRLVWKLYIPAAITGGISALCIINANQVSGKRIAAAASAYSMTEHAFAEYKEHVIEEIGKTKEQHIQEKLVQKKIAESPPTNVVVLGTGHVLCCELHTGRYFKSDMETLKRAQNEINYKIVHELYVRLDEFYDLIGLEETSMSASYGWNSEKLMELQFCPVMSENGEPCLAFDYNYLKPL